ncbi:uncharacterized protein LOC144111364 isoform X2 [Amblyomma americanum]
MALESVFAKALPKVGHANKDTQNGEMESVGADPDDDVPAADLEEGEIVDSGHEDSDDQKPGGGGKPSGPLLKGPPLPPQEVLRPQFAKMEKRKRKKRKKDEPGGPEPKKRYVDHDRMVDDSIWFSPDSGGGPSRKLPMHHGHHGGSMPPRDFGSPGPYDDNYMHMALLDDQLEFEHLCASRGVLLEEMLNDGLLMRIHPCDMSPRGGGCDSPDGSGGPEGHQEGMKGPPPHGGGFPGSRGGRGGGRGKPPFMMDSRRPGPPKKKKKKNKMMPGGRGGGGKRGSGDGPPKRSVCKFYLESKCVKGADCPFSHDVPQPRKADLCKFYLGGYCARGDHCSFMHQDFPCKFFHTGAKCYADTACRFSHQPLTDETRRLLHRYLDNHRDRGDDDNLPTGPGGPEPLDRPDGPDDDRGMNKPPCDEFGGPPPAGKRPSLLGSPPRHVKEAAETWRMQFLGGAAGGGGGHVRGSPGGAGFGSPRGPAMMSPPRGGHPMQGFSPRPTFYMDTLSQSPVRGAMPPPGASPPHMSGPSAMHCLDEGFGGPGTTGPMGSVRPLPRGQIGGFGSSNISSPPHQDQGPSCGPGFVPDGGMSPLGIFFDPSQDHPMSPPPQQQQSIPGLNLLGALSPPHNQAPAPTQIPANENSSDEPRQSPQHAAHHDEADTSDDSSHVATDKKVLPPNLPRRQRELFMRIQQQQRAAGATASTEVSIPGGTSPTAAADKPENPVPVKPEPKAIAGLGNSESSDDDEDYDDDQLLKRLQQTPVETTAAPPTNVLGSSCATTTTSAVQPSSVTLPSVGAMDIAKVLDSLRQQGPSQPQTNFWKQLFSGVTAATAAAASVAEPTPAPFPSIPAASRDPRRARADTQLAKPPTESPQSSRDPRLRDKPLPAPRATEVTFVESKDGDVPYRLASILRALPNYDNIVRSGAIPESKLKNDPRLAKYVGQKLPEAVPPPVEVSPSPPPPAMHSLPAVAILPKPPTVSRRDPRMARHLEQQQPAVENKLPLIAEPPKVTPSPLAEVVPKADPRKAAALAANGSTVVPRMDPRLARRLDQQQKMAGPGETPTSVKPRDSEGLMDGEKPQQPQLEAKPAIKRDPRQRIRGAARPKVSADGAGRKNRMDYASPLSTYESEEDRPSGYSSYQRRPQPRPPVLPVDVVPTPVMPPPLPSAAPAMHDLMPTMPPPGVISDDLLFEADQAMKSLKDVFKTKDPTASPFC